MFVPTPSSAASGSKQVTLPEMKFVTSSVKRTSSLPSDLAESSNSSKSRDSATEGNSSKRTKLNNQQLDESDSLDPSKETIRVQEEDFPRQRQPRPQPNPPASSSTSSTLKTLKPFKAEPVTRPDFVSKYKVDGIPDVYYKENWIDSKTSKRWMQALEALSEWYRPTLKVYGREIQQSREIAAFSTTSDLNLKYSGHETTMHSPFPDILNEIASRLSSDDCLGEEVQFNHVMLNKYANGSINIGKHSDNLENKVIVTVSLGAERSWIMERKHPRKSPKASEQSSSSADIAEKKRWKLANGSLLVMQGDTQKHWKHEIPKELKVKDLRISITFRQLVY